MVRPAGALLLSLAITPAGLAAGSPPGVAAPDARACVRAIRLALADTALFGDARGCWRVGPVTLAMSEAEVERRLGTPVAVTPDGGLGHRYKAVLYAFPAKGAALVAAGRADLRLTELRFDKDRLVAIDNAPGARIDGDACASRSQRPAEAESLTLSALAGPMLRVFGVGVGDRLSVLQHRFGRTPAANASRDWYSYLPVPISFDVDPDHRGPDHRGPDHRGPDHRGPDHRGPDHRGPDHRGPDHGGPGLGRIVGFSIAADDEALTTSSTPELHLRRDPATCRLKSIRFELAYTIGRDRAE